MNCWVDQWHYAPVEGQQWIWLADWLAHTYHHPPPPMEKTHLHQNPDKLLPPAGSPVYFQSVTVCFVCKCVTFCARLFVLFCICVQVPVSLLRMGTTAILLPGRQLPVVCCLFLWEATKWVFACVFQLLFFFLLRNSMHQCFFSPSNLTFAALVASAKHFCELSNWWNWTGSQKVPIYCGCGTVIKVVMCNKWWVAANIQFLRESVDPNEFLPSEPNVCQRMCACVLSLHSLLLWNIYSPCSPLTSHPRKFSANCTDTSLRPSVRLQLPARLQIKRGMVLDKKKVGLVRNRGAQSLVGLYRTKLLPRFHCYFFF